MQFVFAKFSDSTFCPQISFYTLFHVFLKGIFFIPGDAHTSTNNKYLHVSYFQGETNSKN